MKKFFLIIFVSLGLFSTLAYLYETVPAVRSFVKSSVKKASTSTLKTKKLIRKGLAFNKISTLEANFFPEEIIRTNKELLIACTHGTLSTPQLMFFPYLLLDVKFSQGGIFKSDTNEGFVLWSLVDGEMVLDTSTWERSKGFEDCLIFSANKENFKILKTLSFLGGVASRENLYSILGESKKKVDAWISDCCYKNLVTTNGSKVRLHFKHPKLEIRPYTEFKHPIVSYKIPKNIKIKHQEYSPAQVKEIAYLAFGPDFVIRREKKIFIPVYELTIVNPDGSIWVSYWNAINNKRLDIS